jgi:hypothetical protein
MISEYIPRYKAASSKSGMVAEIVHELTREGLRFLSWDMSKDAGTNLGRWYVLSPMETHEKTCRAISHKSYAKAREDKLTLRAAKSGTDASISSMKYHTDEFKQDKNRKKAKTTLRWSKEAKQLFKLQTRGVKSGAALIVVNKNSHLPISPQHSNSLPSPAGDTMTLENYQLQQPLPGPIVNLSLAQQPLLIRGSTSKPPGKTRTRKPLPSMLSTTLNQNQPPSETQIGFRVVLFESRGMGRASGRARYHEEGPLGLFHAIGLGSAASWH